MGTVGLSFGSPTSGAGFDVSATVASIVGNLKNVETPWNTQLTSLKGQDTAISNLGTLLSSVSNDLSQLTDFTGIMAQKTGSSSDTNVLELTAASSSAVAGTHTVIVKNLATTSTGYLAPITSASDTLSGSISIQVGTGKALSISVPTSNSTLAGLASAINSSGVGVTASVLTDSSGSRLSLVSGTSGANGTITVDPSSNTIVDTSNKNAALGYTASTVVPEDAHLTVDGVNLTSSSNTVTNLIAGVTFQLLAPSASESDGSLQPVQVVIGNDNASVESTVNSFVSDYNSLISAVNTQEGNDSSGNPEPLFGSPTLSLLQQQLMSGVNLGNPNGTMDPIAVNTGTTLAGSMSITVGNGATDTFIVGDGTNTANTFYTGSGENTLEGLANAITAANSGTMLGYTAGTDNSTGTLDAVDKGTALSGSISLTVGSGTAENIIFGAQPSSGAAADTLYTGDGNNSLSDLAATINGSTSLGVTADVTTDENGLQTLTLSSGNGDRLTATSSIKAAGQGLTATVVTKNGQSTLSLQSQTAGSSGALAVTSNIAATSDQLLSYAGTTTSNGALSGIPDADNDILSGSLTIQVGNGASTTINLGSGTTLPDGTPVNTLSALKTYINDNTTSLGVTADIVQNSKSNSYSLTLTSNISGSGGTLNITSAVLDTTNTSKATLNYNNSSDVSTLANLGITVSSNYDGSLSFDANMLDSALNTDYSGVLGFFQGVNSWGADFSNILENAGTSSTTGMLSLAAQANSNSESMLNANISKEERLISAEQKSLTAELISANEVMQELPTQLEGINELYSAITGYNQNSGG
jgi:flagellar hook-associated protein 2